MNIAYFTDTYLPQLNGVTISIQNSVKELRKRGHRVYIFAPKIRGYKDEDRDVIRLNSFKVLSSEPEVMFPLLLPNGSYRKIASLSFDLVHGHGNGAFSLLGHQVARMRGIPYVMTFHTLHTRYTHYILNGYVVNEKMVATALKMFGNICDGVIAPSEKMKKELIKYGVKKKIEVIPNIIDISTFSHAKKRFLRDKLSLTDEAQIILSVGRITKEKNFSFIIRAFSKIYQKNPLAHLVIVGQGPEEKALSRLIKKLGLLGRVHLTRSIPSSEMPRVYQDADIFVFASKTETQGLTVFEAGAAGLPLVLVEDEAFLEAAGEENAFVLPLKQKEFINKITLLINDTKKAREMGAASKKKIETIYNTKEIVNRIISYYEYVCANPIKRSAVNKIIPKTTYKILTTASNTFEKIFK